MPELTPQQKQKLQDELTKYAKEGATDEELRSFKTTLISQFEEQNASIKKKELSVTSTGVLVGSTPSTNGQSPLPSKSSGVNGEPEMAAVFDFAGGSTNKSPLRTGPGVTENIISETFRAKQPVSLIPTEEQKNIYENIEEAQIDRALIKADEVYNNALKGRVKAKELAELYQDPRGKEYADLIIQKLVPELEAMGGGLDKEVFGSDKKWAEIERKINEKNIKTYVGEQDEIGSLIDGEIINIIGSSKSARLINPLTGKKSQNITSAGKSTTKVIGDETDEIATTDLVSINLNDPSQYPALISQINNSLYLSDADGKTDNGKKEMLLELLVAKTKKLAQSKAMSPDIVALSESGKTKVAITRVNMDRELGEKDKSAEEVLKGDEVDQKNFETGLNWIQDVDPAKYSNIIRALKKKEKVADGDFRYLARIGQEINNEKIFREGVTNPEALSKETSFDYITRQDKKSIYASAIGEYLKEKGFKNIRQFSGETIRAAASKIPGLTNQSIIDELVAEEGMLFYDAIPKSGKTEAFVRGVMTPFEGIRKTVDAVTKDQSDVYLQSQQYDVGIGGQKVSGGEGQMSTRLASDRGNVWYDVMEGFGQFIPQVLLTRGIGAPIVGATRLAQPALTATQAARITNYGGTFISTYLQEYGSSYEDALQKTGDANLARSMGAINGISAASFELFLPDTKIADRAMGIFRKSYASDLIDIIKKGGSVENMAKAGRGVIEKFVGETLSIAKQEVKEEVGTNLVNYITESIFSPNTAADRNLGNELLETAKATAVSMLIPAVLGGAGAAKTNSDFTVQGLHSAAINFKSYQSALDKSLIDDQITQDEYNTGIKLLSTHRESINNSPKDNSNGKVLSTSERLEYAYQDTLLKAYDEQLKAATGDVAKENIDIKIKKAEAVQRKILLPDTAEEGGDESWRRRVIPIEEQEKLESDETAGFTPQEVIMQAAGNKALGAYNEMVVSGGEAVATEVLRDFAQQSYGITDKGESLEGGSREGALSLQFGNDVVEAAKKAFPTPQSTLAQPEPAPQSSKAAQSEGAKIEIEKEFENIDTAIEAAKLDENGEFEGRTADELLEDRKLLKDDPLRYFDNQMGRMFDYIQDKTVQGEDRRHVEQLYIEYEKIYNNIRGLTDENLDQAANDLFGKNYHQLTFEERGNAHSEADARIDLIPEPQSSKAVEKSDGERVWMRGVNKNNKAQGDRFYSTDEEVAGDYAIDKVGDNPTMEQLSKEEMPKNPLEVGSKEELAEIMDFPEEDIFDLKGDFDKKAKEYAQSKGHDAIVYESGSMDSPEMHVFEKSQSKEPPSKAVLDEGKGEGGEKIKPENGRQENINDLMDDVTAFNKLPKNAKNRNFELNALRVRANDLGLRFDDTRGRLFNASGKRVIKVSTDKPSSISPDFNDADYSTETKQHIETLSKESSALFGLPIIGNDGRQLSINQIQSAIKSVKDGKPSRAAKSVYDFIQDAIETGEVEVVDKITGNSVKVSINEYFDLFKEPVKELTDAEIENLNWELSQESFNFNDEFYGQERLPQETEQPPTKGAIPSQEKPGGTEQSSGVGANTQSDANNIIAGAKVFERFSPTEQRGFAAGGTNHVEASIILARNEGTNEQAKPTNEEQEKNIEDYAKEKGIWVENVNEKYGEPHNSGEEAIVWANSEKGIVTKSQNTLLYGNLQEKLDGITLHNTYFPEAAIKVIGFGKNSNGEFQVIVEQPFIKAHPDKKINTPQIEAYLDKLGFTKTENNDYSNGETIIEDLHTGNAILTPEGNIVVIDPIMRLNTPEQGYGGTRKIQNEITKAPTESTQPIAAEAAQPNEGAVNQTSKPAEGNEKVSDTKIGDAARKFAEKIRGGKISKLGGFKSGTGFDAVWDGSLEAIAKAIEGGAAVADAIQAGLKYIKGTDWYKSLSDKKDFDDKYVDHLEGKFTQSAKDEIKEKRKEAVALRKALKSIDIYSRSGLDKSQVEEIFRNEKTLTPKVQALIDSVFTKLEQKVGTKQYEKAQEESKIKEGQKILDEIFSKIKNGQKVPRTFIRISTSDAADLIPYLKDKYSVYKAISLNQFEEVADSLIDIFGLDVAKDMIQHLNINEKPIAMAKVAMKLREEGRNQEAAMVMADLIQTGTATGQAVSSFQRVKELIGSVNDPTFRTEFQKAMYERMQAERKAAESEFGLQSETFKQKISDLEKQLHEKVIKDNKSLFSKLIDKICGVRKIK